MKIRLLVTTISFLFIIQSQCFAVDFAVGMDAAPVQLSGVVNFDVLNFTVRDSSSYCCNMNNPESVTNGQFASFLNFESVSPAPVARGTQIPSVSAGGFNAFNRRYCWYEENGSSGSFFTAGRGFIFSASGAIAPVVSCEETTLYGNYNTSVTEFNFLELTALSNSTTGETLNGVITLISSVNGQIRTRNFSISFGNLDKNNARIDVSIHDLIQNQSDFGAIIIKHDGAPGQLSAKVSYYDLISSSPLNFTLVGQANLRKGSLDK